jgi:hypothetical protein
MTLPSCCDHHGIDCCQGRNCPERKTRRPIRYAIGYLPVFLRWFDHAAAKQAGHLAASVPPEPIDWQAVVIYGALVLAVCGIAALSLYRP